MEQMTLEVEVNRTWLEKLQLHQFRGFGIMLALVSNLFYATMSLIVKLVDDQHPMQLALSRAMVQFIILMPLIHYKHEEIYVVGPRKLKMFLWLQGFTGAASGVLLYAAIAQMSLGDAVTITQSDLIFTPFMARIFLKEALTVFDVIFALASITGVVLIAKPTFLFPLAEGVASSTSVTGVILAITCALFKSMAVLTIRKLGKQTTAAMTVFYFSFCMAVTTWVLLAAYQLFRLPCKGDLTYIFSLGITGLFGQCLVNAAIQYERAGTVAILRTFQIIIVYIFQVVLLGDIPTLLSLIGASLVFSSSIGIGIRKVVNERNRRKNIKNDQTPKGNI